MSEDNKTEVNNIKTKRKLLKPVHIFIILIAVIGTSFAYFLASGTINLGNITTSNIAMAFSSGENAIIANGIPLYDEEVETDAAYLIFSVKNTGTNTMYTNLYLENITMSSEIFKSEDFKWSLEEGSGITEYEFVTNVREVSSGNFLNIDETDSSNKKIHMQTNPWDSSTGDVYMVVLPMESGRGYMLDVHNADETSNKSQSYAYGECQNGVFWGEFHRVGYVEGTEYYYYIDG